MSSAVTVESSAAGTILPDGAAEIVLSFADPIRIPPVRRPQMRILLGPSDSLRRVIYLGVVDLVGLRFRPGSVRAIVATPLTSLVNRIVPLASVAPALDARLEAGLAGVGSTSNRSGAIQDVIGSFLGQTKPPNGIFLRSVETIRARQGRIKIQELATQLPVSRRQLEREFLANIGLSPKRWCRVVRFQHAVETMSQERDCDWADLAHRIGYADQAHFCREFRTFTDAVPTRAWWPRGVRF